MLKKDVCWKILKKMDDVGASRAVEEARLVMCLSDTFVLVTFFVNVTKHLTEAA